MFCLPEFKYTKKLQSRRTHSRYLGCLMRLNGANVIQDYNKGERWRSGNVLLMQAFHKHIRIVGLEEVPDC
ncbi:hypothetical protein GHT06_021111 [Daphnia sinensis]|uniref:Uncharacterized protein n=1 Tax=Daphnia sinensis TaxID=1820382 RepID=A0AAD5PMN1_9CRUS|nr:hypothetical protein GHT06_021111 [Daphnia sinensis]